MRVNHVIPFDVLCPDFGGEDFFPALEEKRKRQRKLFLRYLRKKRFI
ncbi:hypothetical protein ES707_06384 [subsurface metagenome]|jgi:hypothetical protein